VIEVGSEAPAFTLLDQAENEVSLADFRGRKIVLAFYPMDFSGVCSDQFSIYQEVLPELSDRGVTVLGVSVDHSHAHAAFREKLGTEITLLADFHPKGEVARAYGAYIEERGHNNRSLVLIDGEGVVRWAHAEPTPLSIPGPNLIFDALDSVSD
jgi:peroxiredoxin